MINFQDLDLAVRVTQMTWEADGVLGMVLVAEEGGELPAWAPGAHLDLLLPSGTVRNYSLYGDPADRTSYRIAVRRQQEGRGGSEEIHTTALVGQTLRILAVRNQFQLRAASEYLFIAGGIGITPLLPMIREMSGSNSVWSAIYTGRRIATMAFREELQAIPGGQVEIIDSTESSRVDLKARIDGLPPGALVYCCGPAQLIDAVVSACESAPSPVDYEIERFSVDAASRIETHQQGDRVIQVELALSGQTITVPPDQTILGAMVAAGVAADYFCEEGYCGTCETKVLAGIPDHRDSVLSKKERESGKTILPCVSRSCTPKIVLER
ncbi:PDR/VanB family oxidoreductase [Arthrobacter sp. ISL-28]|uniref:PDR/VanB family oxidoreductase n=1 Tax=Arthrobacter sp. ISL-28 TaxID=2819108 RepID=UPI001BE76ADB|nr:PDR/VanB family oxidoreductase [Arthrobacter sp. ISL-28]MBT2523701.1 oxidoreductase [Arthrobacter sp. ISL-28]